MNSIAVEILLGSLAFSATTLLGVSIFLKDTKSWTHRFFLALAILIDFYIIINFLSLHPPIDTPENQLFWIRMVMFVTAFIGPTLILFVTTFPNPAFKMRKKYLLSLLSLMTLTAIASLTPLIFSGITYPNGDPVPTPSYGMPFFVLDFFGLFVLSFVILFFKLKKAQGKEKKSLKIITWGVIATFSLMGITANLLVIVLKNSDFVFLGPIYPVILVVAIGYAIVKHGLFDFKIIATQALVIGIWIILFSRLIVPKPTLNVVIDTLALALTIVFGVFLIRSVRKEVEIRAKIEPLTQSLKTANDRLKNLDNMKSEFLSFASHQFRSPLTSVKGYTSLILEGTYGSISDRLKYPLTRMYQASNDLTRIVDDFLSISRIEQNRMVYDCADFSIRKVLDEVYDEQNDKLQNVGLRLDCIYDEQDTFIFNGDEKKIKLVLTKILDNAIKHTKNGGIKIELARNKSHNNICISVLDSGIGIAQNDLPKVFDKFSNANNATGTKIGDSGFGLYIAKKIVSAHRGTIEAHSKGIGLGARFIVKLPTK